MAYSEAQVIAGGLIHIPIVIGIFRAVEGRIGRRTSSNVQPSTPAMASTEVAEKAKARKKVHSNVPVNTYRP